MSTVHRCSFSCDVLEARTVADARRLILDATTIVVNLDAEPAVIDLELGGYIPPLASTTLAAGTSVSGRLLALLSPLDRDPAEAVFRELGWEDFYGSDRVRTQPDATVLLRSQQERAGYVDLTPAKVLADPAAPHTQLRHEVKLNLWFSPAGTDCGIHREHAFIETHTQVTGTGRMQKFTEETHDSCFEEQILAPGQTQPSIFGRWRDGRLLYPWHQYRADTDAVWLAIEYHALNA